MDIPSERVEENGSSEARVGCDEFLLLVHVHSKVIPQGRRIGTDLESFLEVL